MDGATEKEMHDLRMTILALRSELGICRQKYKAVQRGKRLTQQLAECTRDLDFLQDPMVQSMATFNANRDLAAYERLTQQLAKCTRDLHDLQETDVTNGCHLPQK